MVPPANRANSESWRPQSAPAMPSPNRAMIEADLSSRGPARRTRHEPVQAKTHDAANLEEDHQDLEDRADVETGTERPYRLLPWFLRGTCRSEQSPKPSRELLSVLNDRSSRDSDWHRRTFRTKCPRISRKAESPAFQVENLKKKSPSAEKSSGRGWKSYTSRSSILQTSVHACTHECSDGSTADRRSRLSRDRAIRWPMSRRHCVRDCLRPRSNGFRRLALWHQTWRS